MKKGQTITENYAKKTQNTIEVFYSEKLAVFYVKDEKTHFPNPHFEPLIICKNEVFKEFLKYLEVFRTSNKPIKYRFSEIQTKMNEFLLKIQETK